MTENRSYYTEINNDLPKTEPHESLRHQYSLEEWKPSDADAISKLEEACWAPWLRTPKEQLENIATNFPTTQLLLRDSQGDVAATLTTSRINWDGNPSKLTTWDEVAGGSVEEGDYSTTYIPDGNTICLMSMNVKPDLRGERLAPKLIGGIKIVAEELEIEHVIGPFRPSGYGNFKLEHGPTPFGEYCNMRREDGQPIDPWLRSLYRQKMEPLRIENDAMTVEVPLDTFKEYQEAYRPDKWKEIDKGMWECGETGSWHIKEDTAIYGEPNIWGTIPVLNSNTLSGHNINRYPHLGTLHHASE